MYTLVKDCWFKIQMEIDYKKEKNNHYKLMK